MNQKKRALFIDLLRGLVLLIMIEVHVFNSMLILTIKESGWFSYLNFINGLVAPSFLFVSGLVFVLSLQKSVDELRKFGKMFWKKIGRIFLILIAGYSLHLPNFPLKKILNNPTQQVLNDLFMVDVLQCIAVGLLFLLFARMIFKKEKQFYLFIFISLIIVLSISPIAWKTEFSNYLPLPLSSYLNRMNGSLFPALPWLNFIFAGALTSKIYIAARENNEEKNFSKRLLIFGAISFIGSVVILNYLLPPSFKEIIPNPFFFMERLGVVLLLLAACWYYQEKSTKHVGFILDVSRESLLVYWLHLQLIYRNIFGGESLVSMFGNKLTIIEAIIVTIILAVMMILTAKGWGRVKAEYPLITRRIVIIFIIIGIMAFVFL
jgi:uncharacterized membrane protein